jgi:hypothetical protein
MRAGLLLVVVVGVEMLAVRPGVPMLSQIGRIWAIAALATAGYLACWRMVDTGYWPLLLIRDGATSLLVAVGIGWWQLAAGGSLALATAGTAQLAVTLLLMGVTAIGASALGVGGWRLRRWLRNGPPFWPRPPGIPDWPPEPGEVWNAEIIHDDDNHKDRPVLIWEREANYANVLTVTSVDKSGRPEHYVKLPLSEWEGVLDKEAWLSLELTPVPYTDFRSMRGECPARFWQQLEAKKMVRERRPSATPAPGFAFRHRLFAAMNRRVGRDARTVPAPPGPRRPAADASSRSGPGRGRRSSRNR